MVQERSRRHAEALSCLCLFQSFIFICIITVKKQFQKMVNSVKTCQDLHH
jgi:hypothetical protein